MQELADYYGLSLSSYVHSLLVRTIRREKAELGMTASNSEPKVNGKLSDHVAVKPATGIKFVEQQPAKKRKRG